MVWRVDKQRDAQRRIMNHADERLYAIRRAMEASETGNLAVFDANVAIARGLYSTALRVGQAWVPAVELQQLIAAPTIVRRLGEGKDTLRLSVSVRFLTECRDFLIADPMGRERLVLVTGPVTPEGTRVLSEINHVPYSEQSVGGVAADPAATHRMLIDMENRGVEMLATFHCHPMHGAGGTAPSSVDMANQARFVRIGWDAVMGIVSQDSYFRLFATHKDIDVWFYGSGATLVSRQPREIILKLER